MTENDQLSEKQEFLESCKAINIGRGSWFLLHTVCSNLLKEEFKNNNTKNLEKLESLDRVFNLYINNFFCLICKEHAQSNSAPIQYYETAFDTIKSYFKYLYRFHKSANTYANKNIFPSYRDDVKPFYFNDQETKLINKNILSYNNTQNGIWHLLFLTATNAETRRDIIDIYTVICCFFEGYYNKELSSLFFILSKEHDFKKAINRENLDFSDFKIALFDWIYYFYREFNKRENIKIYQRDFLLVNYLNLESCSEGCDH